MEYIQFTQFRNNAKKFFDIIEKGKSFVIIRKGKPIAKIIPYQITETGWKRKIEKASLKKNISVTDFIRKEREEI